MEELKKAFNAARSFKEHSTEEAANELGVSRTMLNSFFKGYATSAPLEEKVRHYIYEAGIVRSIKKLGIDPKSKVKDLKETA